MENVRSNMMRRVNTPTQPSKDRVVHAVSMSQQVTNLSTDVAKCLKYVNLFVHQQRAKRRFGCVLVQALWRSAMTRRRLERGGHRVAPRLKMASQSAMWSAITQLRSARTAQERRIATLEAKMEWMTAQMIAMAPLQLPSAVTPKAMRRPTVVAAAAEAVDAAVATPSAAAPAAPATEEMMLFPTLPSPIAPVALPMPPLPLRQQLAAPPTPPTLAELAAVGETKAAPASPLPVVPTTKPGVFNVPTLDHLQRLLISSPFRQSERVAVERAEAKAAAAGAGTAAAAAAAALAKKALPTMEEERI